MMKFFLVPVCLLFCTTFFRVESLKQSDLPDKPEDGDLWVLLVAGSNGWFNYRHQADVCHAYQIVTAHGIPDDHIVVMMYDDIAANTANPTPGIVINRPNGTDVYHDVPKDYTCSNVNPTVFLEVLQGKTVSVGTGKTIKSGPKDHVFVYFADHGAKGLVAFGENFLTATALNNAIMDMHKADKYETMVFYIEACESGSMFQDLLPTNVNVFATTAANATTSSYACYWDPLRQTYLGDVYSIKWLEDSDKENIEKETLEQQFIVVKNETNTSTVCQFGDQTISQMTVGNFQGLKPTIPVTVDIDPSQCGREAVPGPDVPIEILKNRLSAAVTEEEKTQIREELTQMMKNRAFMEDTVRSVITAVTASEDDTDQMFNDNVELTEFSCYFPIVDMFHQTCFNLGLNNFALRMLNPFVNLCQNNYELDVILEAIEAGCTHPPIHGIH